MNIGIFLQCNSELPINVPASDIMYYDRGSTTHLNLLNEALFMYLM